MKATFSEHLAELRSTLIQILAIIGASATLAFLFADRLIFLFTSHVENELVLLSPTEGLTLTLRLSVWVGLIASLPLWMLPLLRFLKPALYSEEVKRLLPFFALSFLFVLLGLTIAYELTLPLTNHYFFAFNATLGRNLWSLSAYIDYVLGLLFAHALAFEMAPILWLLIHLKIVNYPFLKSKRRHGIVLAFILGAVFTPPDVLSQLLLAIPLMGLFELAIQYSRWVHGRERDRFCHADRATRAIHSQES